MSEVELREQIAKMEHRILELQETCRYWERLTKEIKYEPVRLEMLELSRIRGKLENFAKDAIKYYQRTGMKTRGQYDTSVSGLTVPKEEGTMENEKDLCANCDTPLAIDSKIQKAVDKERERILQYLKGLLKANPKASLAATIDMIEALNEGARE